MKSLRCRSTFKGGSLRCEFDAKHGGAHGAHTRKDMVQLWLHDRERKALAKSLVTMEQKRALKPLLMREPLLFHMTRNDALKLGLLHCKCGHAHTQHFEHEDSPCAHCDCEAYTEVSPFKYESARKY